ncbi:hypothetical protein PLESTB_000216700 [Pleodorina starrii]|uniref:Uncharacterized protein n=1 Tax=Pleodorina starrii TaxID=330485 RepID=A0A9W6BC94_9CHLO|nr:hypothetical protein PLESTM_001542300 [Pleodorina starrii]GLC49414.1 hypothetical protein PLESTB_000216700 [Pleodorina starrii]
MAAQLALDSALTGLLPEWFRRRFFWRPQHDMPDLFGKVYIVTGGNSGVGYQVVKWLAAKNATVILATHNMPGARKAFRDIQRDLPHITESRVHPMFLDMTSMGQVTESIAKFVSDFAATGLPLHGLVNAAGEAMGPPGRGADGKLPNHTLATNYFGPFYLTHLLLQPLTASAPSRVVNVCSALGEYMGRVDWEDLRGERLADSDPLSAYNASKRMLSMATREMAVRCRGTGVDVFAVHPGFAATQLWHKSLRRYPSARLFNLAEEWFAQHPFYGALPALFALSEPGLQGRSGLYLGPPLMWPLVRHTRLGDYWLGESRDEVKCASLYDATVKIVGSIISDGLQGASGAGAE